MCDSFVTFTYEETDSPIEIIESYWYKYARRRRDNLRRGEKIDDI
jgi:hypothetical protein